MIKKFPVLRLRTKLFLKIMASRVHLCIIVFLSLINPLSLVSATAVTYNSYETWAIIEGRPVTLDPEGSTCQPVNNMETTLKYYFPSERNYNEEYYGSGNDYNNEFKNINCRSDCPRMHPNNFTISKLLVGENDLGYPGCQEVPDLIQNPSGIVTTFAPFRRKRQSRQICSSVGNKQSGRLQGETYTMWIKPDKAHRKGTLISAMATMYSIGPYTLDLTNRTLELRVMGRSRFFWEFVVPVDEWTHVSLQIIYSFTDTSIAVYANGELLPSRILVQTPSTRAKRQTLGDGSANNPVFIGISGEPYFTGSLHACKVSTVEQCQALGYSAYVVMGQGSSDLSSQEDTAQELLLQAGKNCPDLPAIVRDLYICSSLLPTCVRSQMPLRPCRSLCEEFSKVCKIPNSPLIKEQDCEEFPNTNCVNSAYVPDYGMYRGALRDVAHHGGILTDREIQGEVQGSLPSVPVKPECLCPYPGISMVTDLLCSVPNHRFRSNVHRLGEEHYVPEAINDRPWPYLYDTYSTAWYSKDGLDEITITIQFAERQMVYNMSYQLPSGQVGGLFANHTTIQLLDNGVWRDIAYISDDCRHMNGEFRSDVLPLRKPLCQTITEFDSEVFMNMVNTRSGVSFGRLGTRIHPTIQKFLTGSALRLHLRGHISRLNTFYGISNLAVHGWNLTKDVCECFEGGLMPGVTPNDMCNDDYRCRCREEAGDPEETSYTCYPYTVDHSLEMIPNYGPESGGTIVVIHGGFFGMGHVTVLYGYSIEFEVLNVTETVITCRTPNVTDRVNLYVPTDVQITLYVNTSYSLALVLDERFEFREDPIIESITPLSTFLRGGINQTVVGQYMDSVYAPFMTVTVVHTTGSTTTSFAQPPSVCTVMNSTEMICRSPDVVNLPNEYLDLLAPPVTNEDDEESDRRKRQVNSAVVNKDDFQFYVGFLLDGVKTYNNLSESLPQYGIIEVYVNPEIYPWSDGNRIRVFQPYKGDTHILIEGERMTYGCTLKDYDVRIGDEICEVVQLFVNTLQCIPPATEPALGLIQKDGAPQVTTRVGNINQFVGYLQYHETAWDDPSIKGAILGVIIGIVVIVVIIIVVVVLKKKRAQRRKDTEANKYSEPPTAWSMLPASMKTELTPSMKDGDALKLGRKVGEGNFGTVFVGRYQDGEKGALLVAAKTVKDKGLTTKELMEFLEEATLMKDFKHINVLYLVGVVLQDDRPYVMLPLMENGDLRNFIMKPDNQFTVRDLLDYGLQVACGMEYLAGLKFVHRDLAARNCMVSKDNIVKVADFGLARDIYSNEYYRVENKSRPLPVKWMAPEALDDFKFTTKSDVWSYGVLLWEMLTRGKKPYSHVDNFELKTYLKRGKRLDKPAVAPEEVYELMLQCWNMNPNSRPNFTQITREMEKILSDSDTTEDTKAQYQKADAAEDSYENLDRYVDHTTDRHGYEHLHEEQGYLDMQGQVDYIQAAKELGLDVTTEDKDGYLAPIDSRPSTVSSGSSKPKPSPRKHVGSDRNKSQYQNISVLQPKNTDKRTPATRMEDIDMVEVPAPEDSHKDGDVPLYMNAHSQNVQYVKT